MGLRGLGRIVPTATPLLPRGAQELVLAAVAATRGDGCGVPARLACRDPDEHGGQVLQPVASPAAPCPPALLRVVDALVAERPEAKRGACLRADDAVDHEVLAALEALDRPVGHR